MQIETFNKLPINIQNFIKETNINIESVCTNDFNHCITKKVLFTVPYGFKGGGKTKVAKRFSIYDANRIKNWFEKLAVLQVYENYFN